MVLEDLKSKVALKAIACATQLDGLVVVDIKGKLATRDMHLFGVNPTWSKKLRIWGEAVQMKEHQEELMVNLFAYFMSYFCRLSSVHKN